MKLLLLIEELDKWKRYNVYDTVDNIDHKFINLRWVLSEKYVNGKLNVKTRLVAKGFQDVQEMTHKIRRGSPACNKENIRLCLKYYCLNEMDIKTAFLQKKNIDRDVYVKPSKEAE